MVGALHDSAMMVHRSRLARRVTLIGASLLAFVPLVITGTADATIAPSATISVDSPTPAGGVITGTVYCLGACVSSQPSFVGLDGKVVQGQFAGGAAPSWGPFVFIPDSPLPAGTYSAHLTGPYYTAPASFTVVDAVFEAPTFTSSVTAETLPEGPLMTCQQADPRVATAGFAEKTRVRPLVVVSFVGFFAKQYRYELTLPGELPRSFSAPPTYRSFDVVGDELCFDILGQPYGNEPVATLGHDCVSLAGLGVGVKNEAAGDIHQTLLGCVVPPAGYESEWCATFAPAFASKSCDGLSLDACFAARRGCSEGDHPSDQQERTERDARAPTQIGGADGNGSGGSGGFAGNINGHGGTSAAGSSSAAAGRSAKTPPPREDSAACSLGLAPSGTPTSWLASLAPLFFLARRRRRRVAQPVDSSVGALGMATRASPPSARERATSAALLAAPKRSCSRTTEFDAAGSETRTR